MNTLQRMEVRAKEAAARALITYLSVPNIYFDAHWPTEQSQVDLLAIDRAGTGDVHLVEVKGAKFQLAEVVEQLMHLPAQFRWIAFLQLSHSSKFNSTAPKELYPTEGMGRVGLIEIIRKTNDELGSRIRFNAERFPGNLSAKVDRFAQSATPDIEFR